MMRQVLLYLVACFLFKSVHSLYEDQIGKFDWTHRGIGTPKYAEFDALGSAEGGPARRVIVATHHNVLAALNTKNGALLWRQVLETDAVGNIDSLLVSNGEASIVTSNPPLLRTFDTYSSALITELPLQVPYKNAQSYGSRFVRHSGSQVTVVHVTDATAEVYVLCSSTGAVLKKFSTQAPWLTPETQCALSSTSLVCVEHSLALLFSLPLTASKGQPTFHSSSLSSFGITVTAAPSDNSCQYLRPAITIAPVHGSPLYLMLTSGDTSVILQCSEKDIIKVKEDALAVSALQDDGALYVARQNGLELQITGYDLKSGSEIVARSLSWNQTVGSSFQPATVRYISVQQYQRRGDGEPAIRALVVLEDDSVHLLAAPGHVWSREEALSSVLAIEALDLPVSPSAMSMHEQGHHKDIFSNFVQRIVAQSTEILLQLAELLEGSLGASSSSPDGNSMLTRDEFNLHKLIVVATASGKVFALDNWNGKIVWSNYVPQLRALPSSKLLLFLQRSVAHFPLQPVMSLVGMQKDNCNGAIYTFNPLTGEPSSEGVVALDDKVSQAVMLSQQDKSFTKPVVIVSPELSVRVFPALSGETLLLQHRHVLYITTRNATHLTGHSLRFSEPGNLILAEVWCGHFPPGNITAVYPKRSIDKLHSAGRVLADRSVLYKYSNPNLAVVVAQGYDNINKNVLAVYLVDLVSGAVIDWISHQRVSGPVHVMHSENWVVYTYHNDKLRRHELHSLEMFEGPNQSNATAFTSFASLPLPPIVEKQAYILPQGIQAAGITITEKSITNKFLLLALQNGGVIQVARWMVDPRRPINSASREEGLMPYTPEIQLPPTEVISYNQTLPRVSAIYSGPTGLESTCIVFVYGLDLFFTRVFPSKMYDMLKDDFDYILIAGVLLSLTVAAIVTKKLAQRKALYNQWK